MTIHGKAQQVNAVCEQDEWDEMEARRPGYHTLLHTGLKTEQEAEKLARGTAGESKPRGHKKQVPPALLATAL